MKKKSRVVIKASEVTKKFKEVLAVNELSIEILQGQFVAILGPNGAGKSTFIEMLEGVQTPDSGSILINDLSWKFDSASLRPKVGISFQETRFMDKVSVEETLRLFASFYRADRSIISELLDLTGLHEKRKTYTVNLSGGQKQKLALAISLVNKAEILFLDEPTTGLDPQARREVWNILKEMKKRDVTVIMTTHYMEEAEQLCDRIVFMYKGEILADGSFQNLITQFDGRQFVEITFQNSKLKSAISKLKNISSFQWKTDLNRGSFISKDPEKAIEKIIQLARKEKAQIRDIYYRRMTLDDLFISMTGRHLHD